MTVSQLRSDGIVIPYSELFRGGFVLSAAAWSVVLVFRIGALYDLGLATRISAAIIMAVPITSFSIAWVGAFLS